MTLGYGRRAVLEDLSFHLCSGELLGIVGPNGSGKTTALRAILGLVAPLAGRIRWSARPVLGCVPQRESIDTIMPVTALEVALMGRAPRLGPLARLRAVDHRAAEQALDEVGVLGLARHLFRALSGGQQQRVLIARAMAAALATRGLRAAFLTAPAIAVAAMLASLALSFLSDLPTGPFTVVLLAAAVPVGLGVGHLAGRRR